jgi:very-short-patch-repair endonuclease
MADSDIERQVEDLISKSGKRFTDRIREALADDYHGRLGRCESPIERVFYQAWSVRLIEMSLIGSPHGGSCATIIDADQPFDNPDRVGWHDDDVCQIDLFDNQVPIGDYRADFVVQRFIREMALPPIITSAKVVIECDGHDFHERTPEQAARDKLRDRTFQSMGYVVLRFTGRELWRDPDACAEQVNDCIENDIARKTIALRNGK